MSNKKFVLLDLEDSKAQKITSAVSNSSSKKILSLLADIDHATESEISKKLDLSLPTVHYNLKLLVSAGLVEWKHYHYSEKGKEVKHYNLVDKHIIISPKKDPAFLSKLSSIFPAFLFTILGAFFISLYNRFQSPVEAPQTLAIEESSRVKDEAVTGSEPILELIYSDPATWFLLGALLVLIIIILSEFVRYKRKYLSQKRKK